jgi:hypothetical protein
MTGLELALDSPGAELAIIFALAIALGFVGARLGGLPSVPRKRPFRGPFQLVRSERSPRPQGSPRRNLTDVGEQLRAVMAAPFERRRVFNFSEYRAFKVIEDDLAAARRGHRVFAQISLGEILQSPNDDAFRSINSKRVDILIVDRGGWPILAVEYQGAGHYQGTAAARDAIKKEALRKAGVKYIEVFATDSEEQIRSRVREHLGWNTAAA